MQLLGQYSSAYDADEISNFLEEKGILTFVSSKNSHQFGKYQTGATKVGLWVVLGHQYDDAVCCLKNSTYIAGTALSPEELKEIKKNTQNASFKYTIKILTITSAIIASIALFLYLFIKV